MVQHEPLRFPDAPVVSPELKDLLQRMLCKVPAPDLYREMTSLQTCQVLQQQASVKSPAALLSGMTLLSSSKLSCSASRVAKPKRLQHPWRITQFWLCASASPPAGQTAWTLLSAC